ncbi:hypothetical protein TNCV_3574101 [Trichonephila clavipes]|nr:hypothetical protein TNCV_3574101 [Trichonephila clavipes]
MMWGDEPLPEQESATVKNHWENIRGWSEGLVEESGQRGRNWSDVTRARKEERREGLTIPKRIRGAPKTQWEGECCFFCSRNEKERVCKEKLTDTTAGGTKLEPALTLIPVLMRGN